MYNKGDYVLKIPEGICKIADIGYFDISGMNTDKQYYILVPIKDDTSKVLQEFYNGTPPAAYYRRASRQTNIPIIIYQT